MSNNTRPGLSALTKDDPPRLGPVTLLGRLDATDAGVIYAGSLEGASVATVLLSQGAELDSYGRARFLQAIDQHVENGGAEILASQLDDGAVAPWVAVPAATWPAALSVGETLLAPVTLKHLPGVGLEQGPAFRPHWFARSGPGRWHIWPLPWPALIQSASRWSLLLSFACVIAIAALALLIAVKVFETQPPVPPPPPPPQPTNQPAPTLDPDPNSPPSTGPTAPPIV